MKTAKPAKTRTARIEFALFKEEKAELEKAAKQIGSPPATWIRTVMLAEARRIKGAA